MATLSSHYPAVVSYNEVRESLLSYDEILVLEDLGDCEDSSVVLKRLFESDPAGARDLEEDIIQQTRFMLDSGMVDIDHRLNNFIVTADGFPVRIDFEHCKEYRYPYMHKESVGRMLGVLIGSHVFASQPDTGLTEDFCDRLFAKLRMDKGIARIALSIVDEMLEKQQERRGLVVKFEHK